MTPLSEILKRRRLRLPPDESDGVWSERLPDGTPALEVGLRRPDLLTGNNRQVTTRPRVVGRPSQPLLPVSPGVRGIDSPVDSELISPRLAAAGLLRQQASGGSGPLGIPAAAMDALHNDMSLGDETRQRAVTFDPVTGKPNESYYRHRNDIGGLYDAYRNWEPHGAKRGFKNSLKSALLGAAEGVRAAPDNPIAGALSGLAIGAGAGTAAPNFLNRLRRQTRLPQLAAEAGSELERQKTQSAIDMGQLVPVELDSGETVMVPAKQAATLRSKQQEIGLRGETLAARKKRWDSLSSNERKRAIIAEYKAGMLNHDPQALDQAARELNIPGQMLPAFISGQMRDALDSEGNLIQVNRQTGDVTTTGTPSFEITKEVERNRRATQMQNRIDARTRFVQEQMNQRAAGRGGGVTPDRATARKSAELIGKIEQRRRTMARADELLKANPDDAEARAMREKAQAEGEGFAAELNALGAGYEAGPGDLGYPYYKRGGGQPTGKYAGKRISTANLPEAAKRLGVSVDEARRILESEGAVIY